MKRTSFPLRACLAALLLFSVTGCQHTVKLALKPTELPASPKLHQPATLVLTEEFIGYQHEVKLGGTVYPLGPTMQDYARRVTSHCFQDVQVVSSVAQASPELSRLILIPHPHKSEQSVPVWAWDKANATMAVQWTALEAGTHDTIWLRTITAEATQTGGTAFTYKKNQRLLFQNLFDDLSLKTQAAFLEAPELRQHLLEGP